jgi:hypothetical protein
VLEEHPHPCKLLCNYLFNEQIIIKDNTRTQARYRCDSKEHLDYEGDRHGNRPV